MTTPSLKGTHVTQLDPPAILIDLGEEHGAVPETSWAPRRLGRHLHRLGPWRVAALAATLVLALLAGGAVPWPGPPLRLVARVPVVDGASVLVDGGTMVVLGNGPGVGAYALDDGASRWRTPLDIPVEYGGMVVSDGVLLVGRDPESIGPVSRDPLASTVALDERSGRTLWSSAGTMYTPLTGTGTVLVQSPDGAAMQLVDVRTGTMRWSMPTGDCQIAFDEPDVIPLPAVSSQAETRFPHALAELCPDGTLTMVALPDGSRRTFQLPPMSPISGTPPQQMITAGPVLVVEEVDGPGSATIEAYRWADGTRVWKRPGFGMQDVLFACDGKACIENQGVGVALDPANGAEIRDPSIYPGIADVTAFASTSGSPNRLMLVPRGRKAPITPGFDATVAQAWPERVGVNVQPFVVVFGNRRVASDPAPVVGAPLVEVVTPDGTVRPLQHLPGINASLCTTVAAYLVCPTAPGQLSVWQYPTG